MKKLLFLLAVISVMASCDSAGGAGKTHPMANHVDSLSYALGTNIGDVIQITKSDESAPKLNMDLVVNGVSEAANDKSRLKKEEVGALLQELGQILKEAQGKKEATEAIENLSAAENFLEENKAKDGVITLDSGLQYKVTTEGTGASPKATDKVKVHYSGTLLDGTVFDSSYKRGEPVEFPLNGVIKGWTEGIPTMKVGGKSTFYIHPNLGYGPRGNQSIPGNSILIFEVELLDILSPEKK